MIASTTPGTRAGTSRRLWLAGALALACGGTWAQAANEQPIRLLVGYAAGGPVDAVARQFAPLLSKALGQPVVVENRAGAGGALAGDTVAKAAPNGLTLYFAASPTITISPNVLKAMPFDPGKDITPIAPILSYANVLVINKDLPFKTLPELVAHAKANPGKLAYGSAGVGASNHLSGELFARRAGIELNHIPYKGNAPAMTDVIGGQLAMMFDIIGTGRNYVNSGRVRAVAVTSKDRNASMPDVPSMRELGIADYDVGGWYGLYGPPRMPAEMVQRLHTAVQRTLALDEFKAKLAEQGYDLWQGSPQTLQDRATRERALWATVTKGIQVE